LLSDVGAQKSLLNRGDQKGFPFPEPLSHVLVRHGCRQRRLGRAEKSGPTGCEQREEDTVCTSCLWCAELEVFPRHPEMLSGSESEGLAWTETSASWM
jgi:hypothetical protein